MADYWKSQPKKFCQYCKCWIADNKPSVEFHERGKNHKENVAAKIEEIKKKSVAKAKQEKKMSKEFAAMEEAALKAYEEDLKRLTAQSTGESLPPSEPPAKPQKKPKRRPANVPSQSGSSSCSHPDAWVGGTTGDGQVYYYNTITGESQWEKPDGFVGEISSSAVGHMQNSSDAAWMEAVSPDGYMYYYNTETGESSWEKPDCFNPEDICPPGVESPREVTGASENSSPAQPEPPSAAEDSSDPPKDTPEPEPEPEPEPDQTKQSSGPKISFRKRKDEPIQTSSDDGGEKNSDDGGNGEEKEEDTSVSVAVKEVVTPAKRPRKINPYGAWEKIQPEEDPYEKVDLQLPQMESVIYAPIPADIPPEPQPRFKERTITSLGDEGSAGATFKKRKTENGKSRSLRQRGKDE